MYNDFITPYLFFKNELDNFVIEDGYHDKWTILILTEGSYDIQLLDSKTGTERIKQNDIYIIPAFMPFKRKVVEHISYFCLQFYVNNKSADSFEIPVGKTENVEEKRLSYNLWLLNDCLNKQNVFFNNFKMHILFDILYMAAVKPSVEHSYITNENIRRAIEYIDKHYTSSFKLDDIANDMHISTSGLIYNFKKHTGLKPYEYALNLRSNLAKRLLLQTDLNISQIAEKCGFDNVYYFSNFFKKTTGVPPSKFRIMNKL